MSMQTKKITSSLTRLVLASCTLAALPSCALMKVAMQPRHDTQEAANPLTTGQPLEMRKKSEIGIAQEQDCSIWPFEDVTTVTATEAQICVTMIVNKPDDSIFSGKDAPEKQDVYVKGMPSSESQMLQVMRKRNQKVGQCNLPGHNKIANVWTTEYQGCTPNNGMLTAASTSLKVDKIEWQFPTAAAAPDKTAAK